MATKDQLPYPTVLIPSLTMSYDVVRDELILSLNGAPLRGPVTNSLALRKRCEEITAMVIALIREDECAVPAASVDATLNPEGT